jgi:hypothetical protein
MEELNTQIDRLTSQTQDLQDQLNLATKHSPFSTESGATMPDSENGTILGWGAAGLSNLTLDLTGTGWDGFVDLASTALGEGASLIGFHDSAGNFAAEDVEAAIVENYQTTVHVPASANGYGYVIGVLRNTGTGWYVLDDANHTPLGIASVDDSTGDIVLTYDFTASATITSIVALDESFARTGLKIGASVGNTSLTIETYHPLEVQTGGAAVAGSAYLGLGTNVTYSSSGSDLTLTHPSQTSSVADGLPTSLTMRSNGLGNAGAYISTQNKTSVVITALDPIHGFVDSNGSTFNVTSTNTTVPTVIWDGSSKAQVTHATGSVANDPMVTVKGGPYAPTISTAGASSFDVQFYNVSTGALVSGGTPPADLDFFFTRGSMAPSTLSSATKTFLRRGPIPVDAQDVTSTSGNIWVFCIFAK